MGLLPLTCVDLARGFGDGKRLTTSRADASFASWLPLHWNKISERSGSGMGSPSKPFSKQTPLTPERIHHWVKSQGFLAVGNRKTILAGFNICTRPGRIDQKVIRVES